MSASAKLLASNTGTSVTTLTVTASSGSTFVNDSLLVVVYLSTGTVSGITDSNGNNYVRVRYSATYQVWMSTGDTGTITTSSTITLTVSASATVGLMWLDLPGANLGQIEQLAQSSGSSGAMSLSLPSRVSAQSLVVGCLFGSTASTAPASPWALAGSVSSQTMAAYWQQQSGGPTTVPTITATMPGSWSAVLISFTCLVRQSSYGLPVQNAGAPITSPNMNTLALAAAYIMRPDMVQVVGTASQSLAANSAAAVAWGAATKDTMGGWNKSSPPWVFINVQGYYNVRYSVPYTQAANNLQCCVSLFLGSNNPLGSSGTQFNFWQSDSIASSSGASIASCNGGGDIPYELFPGDYLQVSAFMTTASTIPNTSPRQARMTIRWVSA